MYNILVIATTDENDDKLGETVRVTEIHCVEADIRQEPLIE